MHCAWYMNINCNRRLTCSFIHTLSVVVLNGKLLGNRPPLFIVEMTQKFLNLFFFIEISANYFECFQSFPTKRTGVPLTPASDWLTSSPSLLLPPPGVEHGPSKRRLRPRRAQPSVVWESAHRRLHNLFSAIHAWSLRLLSTSSRYRQAQAHGSCLAWFAGPAVFACRFPTQCHIVEEEEDKQRYPPCSTWRVGPKQ